MDVQAMTELEAGDSFARQDVRATGEPMWRMQPQMPGKKSMVVVLHLTMTA